MRISGKAALMASAVGVSACGGGGGDGADQYYLGPGATEAEAIAAITELETRVSDVFAAEGPTLAIGRPAGTASYTGVIAGQEDTGLLTGPQINYAADLDLDVDFDAGTVIGRALNFLTTLAGYDHPSGTIPLTGTVIAVGSNAGLDFSGTATLSQGSHTADVDISSSAGVFGGTDADALDGAHMTTYTWTEGSHAGGLSGSDGGYVALRD